MSTAKPTVPAATSWLPPSLRLSGVPRTLAIAGFLVIVAAVTQWLVWLRDSPAGLETFVGPARSDYQLSDFTMTTLDEAGKLAFRVVSPRLARHPFVGSLEIDEPRFLIRDSHAAGYQAQARSAWVSADAKELRLLRDVIVKRPAVADVRPFTLRSSALTGYIDTDRLTSDAPVTITQPGSILSGVGLDADLRNNRLVLRQQVKARYERQIKP